MAEERQRQGRKDEVAVERRRRDDTLAIQAQRLPIPPEIQAKLQAEGRTPRWVNDTGNRMYRFTKQDDYDKVEGVEPVPVGVDETGKPILAHLLSKPQEFIREDQARMDAKRQEVERGMLKGRVPGKPGQEAAPVAGVGGAEIYVDKAASIGRGNQIIE
jgi:hypothetical protein